MWSIPVVMVVVLLFSNIAQASTCRKPRPDEVKGVYLWAKAAENPATLNRFIKLAETTEINAFVIDANETGNFLQEHNRRILARLAKHCIYAIARVVVFKADASWYAKTGDPASLQGGTLFLHDVRGRLWRDAIGNPWLNPFDHMVRKVMIEQAEYAAEMGFDEIQFDYVRFPTDAHPDQPISAINYNSHRLNAGLKTEAITDFVREARKRLSLKKVRVSLDVFGEAAVIGSKPDPAGIGQDVQTLLHHLDIVSPMVYPRGFAKNRFGCEIPAQCPYKVVRASLTPLVRYQREHHRRVVVRPWIQDFTANNWGTDIRVPYGPEEVREQLRALKDLGIKTWMLWNSPRSGPQTYSTSALRPRLPAVAQEK